jgi:hypothetical protein
MSKITSLSFSKQYQLPIEEKDSQRGFMKWGKKNDYPFFLIELLQGSAWHQGIIKNKTYYIAGGGLETVSGDLTAFLANPFADFDMNEIAQRMAFDFEVFGAMAVIGTWNREGTKVVRWEHMDIDLIRITEDERLYYVSDDWSALQQSAEKTNYRSYPALNENNRTGSFMLYYKEPSKQAKGEKGIYPKPPYYGGITAIQTDVDISKFHMYELQNGFKAGTLINLASGEPETSEEERKIKEQIKGRTQSVEDAGEIIITFSNGADEAPTVMPLNGNNLHERYAMTEKSVQQNILVAHSVVAPSLFGIAPNGSFNAAETDDLFEIYKNTYINSRQKQIEWLMNYMVQLSGAIGTLKLVDVRPIVAATPVTATPVTDASGATEAAQVDVAKSALNGAQIASLVEVAASIKSGILTPDAALQIVLASFPTIGEAQARKIVGLPSTTLSSCDHKHEFSADEIKIFSEYGVDSSEYKVLKTNIIEWDTPSDEVFSKEQMMFATIGEVKANISALEKSILSMLIAGEDASSIASATGASVEEIAKSTERLIDFELLVDGEVSDLGKQLLDEAPAPIDQFMVVYSYQKRPGIEGPPKLPNGRTRDFCARLLDINRLYTRDEINNISSRVDRNVWNYRGGWYTNPQTQVSTPYCRHIWVQQLVIKKQ